ncbi:unnamed protein product [Rotaria sp. Silwood1]|nr:unnamed protein product [Rotaria sp. Silwood1]CAF1629096.1 unnamed protein product [Rotaria sp. Silwood1]CAF3745454.1 unnamed protein product [Rotaria sp. Silwood1]CAF3806841.1 unnamed protein product [Rotaria sp. Silwood1]CAF3818609.1 unnamed protein product [Rotaria sp. Silwood1]
MGCNSSKEAEISTSIATTFSYNDGTNDNIKEESIFSLKNRNDDDAIITKLTNSNDHIEIQIVDLQAFHDSFVQQRQQVIDNCLYRSTIESWQPESLE